MPQETCRARIEVLPVRYDPSVEPRDKDEAQTEQGLTETVTKIQQQGYEDVSRASRRVHAKSHGILTGELQVLGGLPASLSQGLFAMAAAYPIMRFSTIPEDVLDGSIFVPRGLALKVVGVSGQRCGVRKSVYESASRFRAEHSHVRLTKPKTIAELQR